MAIRGTFCGLDFHTGDRWLEGHEMERKGKPSGGVSSETGSKATSENEQQPPAIRHGLVLALPDCETTSVFVCAMVR